MTRSVFLLLFVITTGCAAKPARVDRVADPHAALPPGSVVVEMTSGAPRTAAHSARSPRLSAQLDYRERDSMIVETPWREATAPWQPLPDTARDTAKEATQARYIDEI